MKYFIYIISLVILTSCTHDPFIASQANPHHATDHAHQAAQDAANAATQAPPIPMMFP